MRARPSNVRTAGSGVCHTWRSAELAVCSRHAVGGSSNPATPHTLTAAPVSTRTRAQVNKAAGPFQALLCVGAFCGEDGPGSELGDYLSGAATAPVATYFIDALPGGKCVTPLLRAPCATP
jgi:hypothetical protein